MSDTIITTRNKPRRNIVTSLTAQNSVRVYRQSPEDIVLQIRRTADIVSVTLTFAEAWQLVDALIDTLPSRA